MTSVTNFLQQIGDRIHWSRANPARRPTAERRPKRAPAVTATYLIGCDLQNNHNCAHLEAAINRLGETRSLFRLTWLVLTEVNAWEIREYLSEYLEEGDKILVVRCGSIASWAGFDSKFNDWFTRCCQLAPPR